jgi:hypothetical protein
MTTETLRTMSKIFDAFMKGFKKGKCIWQLGHPLPRFETGIFLRVMSYPSILSFDCHLSQNQCCDAWRAGGFDLI